MSNDKPENEARSRTCKNSGAAFCYVAVPAQDIHNLEEARLTLIRMLEAAEVLNMATMLSITNPMWKITHTKYKPVVLFQDKGRVLIKSPGLICPECGHYPLTLEGTKTLSMPKDRTSYCDVCSYEAQF